jgi:hypothetical protein
MYSVDDCEPVPIVALMDNVIESCSSVYDNHDCRSAKVCFLVDRGEVPALPVVDANPSHTQRTLSVYAIDPILPSPARTYPSQMPSEPTLSRFWPSVASYGQFTRFTRHHSFMRSYPKVSVLNGQRLLVRHYS